MHLGAELRVSIEDQVLVVRAFGESFAKLLHHPITGRVLGDIPVDDLSAIMPNQEQAVQNPEVCCDHGEEIHPGNQLPVILQKGSPKLSSPVAAMQPRKVSRDGSLGNLEPQLQQLAVDAGSSPGRVLARHGVEGSPNLGPGDRSADRFASRAKAPVKPKAFPVPSNDGVRLHDQKRIRPLRPHSAQQNPEQSVGTVHVHPFSPPFQDDQLLPQGDDFKSQVMTRPNKASQPYEHTADQPKHESVLITRLEGTPLRSLRPCFGDLQPLAAGVFRIDHDQVFQSTATLRYQRPKNAEWVALTYRYDSGLVVSGIADAGAAISLLTPNQQVSVGLACNGVFATVAIPTPDCPGPGGTEGEVTSKYITLPQGGYGPFSSAENDDHNPDRVKPRNVINLGVGTDNLLHEGKKL